MSIERTLHADFEDLWVVYFINDNEVREVKGEFYGKRYAENAKNLLLEQGTPACLGRTIRFTLKNE